MNIELLARAIHSHDTEADAFIVCLSEQGTIQVTPYWECEDNDDELLIHAAAAAATFADKISEGTVEAVVVDKRITDTLA